MQDLVDMRSVVAEIHPAMVPALGDDAFLAREEASFQRAMTLAHTVDSEAGYRFALRAYASALGDDHLRVRFTKSAEMVSWPGVLVQWTNGHFKVETSERAEIPAGAILSGCDGEPAAEFARKAIGGFWTDWSSEARRFQHGFRLLIDYENPFVSRPRSCEFFYQNTVRTVDLEWREIERRSLSDKMQAKRPKGRRPFGVEPFGDGGLWISLPWMGGAARDMITRLARDQDAVDRAKVIVVDVRGNNGGNSALGDDLAEALGLQLVEWEAVEGAFSIHWRASRGNARALRAYAERDTGLSQDAVLEAMNTAERIASAAKDGADFHPRLPEVRARLAPRNAQPGDIRSSRIWLLTDHWCFSSCLLMVEAWRAAGVAHIGTTTDTDTRYLEASARMLPSGRATMTTMQKVVIPSLPKFGPFAPTTQFTGDIQDDRAVKEWVTKLAQTNDPEKPNVRRLQ